ncbi:MAG: elongation factor P [Bacteroidota bacterium]
MANTSEIRNGLTINHSNDIYSVVEFLHVKPGKGPAFVRTKLKSLTNGKVVDHTFPSGHKIDIVRIERRKFQYLYKDDMGYHFMNNETYDQISLQEDFIDNPDFVKEGMTVDILYHAQEEKPLIMELPPSIEVEITYTEPGLKGDTATNATKPAKIETGGEIRVPLFINEGDKVRVDTKTGAYMERVKS